MEGRCQLLVLLSGRELCLPLFPVVGRREGRLRQWEGELLGLFRPLLVFLVFC